MNDDDARPTSELPPDVWAFDVDGCIIDLLGGATLRPHVPELLRALRARGATSVLWSGGGSAWAQAKAERFELAGLIDGYYGKPDRGPDGRWLVDHMPLSHRPTVCVDDSPTEVPLGVRIVGVRPYLAPNAHDRVFADLVDDVANGRL